MKNTNLATAMADKCADIIQEFAGPPRDLPKPLQPTHLLWMCRQISAHADSWSAAHIHRWIGFIQSALLANGMLDLAGLKAMFDDAKNAFGSTDDDQDLVDHLNPSSDFEFEIGGQG